MGHQKDARESPRRLQTLPRTPNRRPKTTPWRLQNVPKMALRRLPRRTSDAKMTQEAPKSRTAPLQASILEHFEPLSTALSLVFGTFCEQFCTIYGLVFWLICVLYKLVDLLLCYSRFWLFLFSGPLKVNIFSLRTTEIQYIRSAQRRQTDRRADGQTDRQIIALSFSSWRGGGDAAALGTVQLYSTVYTLLYIYSAVKCFP